MPIASPVRRRSALVLAAAAAGLLMLAVAGAPAGAAPSPSPTPSPSASASADVDGRIGSLQGNLEVAARGYLDAKNKLEASKKRQAFLQVELANGEKLLAQLESDVGAIAAAAYRGSRAQLTTTMLLSGDGSSPELLLENATTLQYLVSRDDQTLHRLVTQRKTYGDEQKALTAEVVLQQQQVTEMAKRKDDAERALNYAAPTGGFTGGPPSAVPAPRNADGSWPPEGCTLKDPTTTGCLTPRTLHALEQARAAGFNRYTACYRDGNWGEHPLGRACDFAAYPNGFVDARATGDNKEYGDRLAAWFLSNADRLGVLYIIWYKQIWMSSTGWRLYSGDGSVAGDHYNHVHLSEY